MTAQTCTTWWWPKLLDPAAGLRGRQAHTERRARNFRHLQLAANTVSLKEAVLYRGNAMLKGELGGNRLHKYLYCHLEKNQISKARIVLD